METFNSHVKMKHLIEFFFYMNLLDGPLLHIHLLVF